MKTRMTEMLGVEHPIQVGTMHNISNAEFVAASANSGAFACLVSAMFPDKKSLIDEITKLRSLTDKPFGVNVSLFPGADARTADVTLDILADLDVKIIETAGRSPEPHLTKIRRKDVIHVHKCARLKDAVKADKLGVDIVTVVGAECGGHPGMEDTSTMVLIPEVANAINAPLIAGGGFCDGKTLVAGLALGADGILMGSAFLNTDECRIHPRIKEKLIQAEMTDTMIIQKSIKSPVRVLKNKWAMDILNDEENGASLEELLPKLSGIRSGKAWIEGTEEAVFPCGQVIGRINEKLSVSQRVHQIMEEALRIQKRVEAI